MGYYWPASRFEFANAQQLIADELEKDGSDTGIKSALYAQVVVPDQAVKKAWLAKIQAKESDLTFSKIRTAMSALYPSNQNDLDELTADERIASLAQIDKEHDHSFMRSYASLIPATCSEESVARLTKAAKELTQLSAGTQRALLQTLQNDERCLLIKRKISIE